MVDQRVVEWRAKFSGLQGGKEIVSLTGETSTDLRLLEKGDVIVCTPLQASCFTISVLSSANLSFPLVGYYITTMATAQERSKRRSSDRGRSTARWW